MDAHTAVRAPLDMAALYDDCLALNLVLEARSTDWSDTSRGGGAVAEAAAQAAAALFRFVNVSTHYAHDSAAGAAMERHFDRRTGRKDKSRNRPSGQDAHSEGVDRTRERDCFDNRGE